MDPQQPAAARVRSTAAVASLIAYAGLCGLEILLYANASAQLSAWQDRLASGGAGSSYNAYSMANGLVPTGDLILDCSAMHVVFYVTCAIIFLGWISRSFRAMKAARPGLIGTSPGYAVGGFFIPLVNLTHGYNMVKELWQATNPSTKESDIYVPTQLPALMNWWWGLFLGAGIMGLLAKSRAPQTIDDVKDAMTMAMVFSAAGIVVAILAINVVLATTNRINTCLALLSRPPTIATPTADFVMQPTPTSQEVIADLDSDYATDQGVPEPPT
jgi:hypothetical protein